MLTRFCELNISVEKITRNIGQMSPRYLFPVDHTHQSRFYRDQ